MTVAELIEVLRKEEPSGVVCIHDDQGVNPIHDEPVTRRVGDYWCFVMRATSWP